MLKNFKEDQRNKRKARKAKEQMLGIETNIDKDW